MSSEDHYLKEEDLKPGVTRVRWIRDGHPDSFLDLHPPGFYQGDISREQKLRTGIQDALKMLVGTHNDLRSVKAQEILKAALED